MISTILMTVGHGLVSRNLLRNQFLERIKQNNNIKLVIVTPAAGDKEFEKEFSSHNVIYEKMQLRGIPAGSQIARRIFY